MIEHAERTLAEQADVTLGEASRRVGRYARFRDLSVLDVSRAVLAGTIRLLTIRENDNLARRGVGSDGHPNLK